MKRAIAIILVLAPFLLQAQSVNKVRKDSITQINLFRPTPLFVVDGVRKPKPDANSKSSDLNLNPEDIEKIEVLKGKSATLLYGEEGKDGVILITTRKSKVRKTEQPH
jgi:TonB-dependent SusC/RagA subfamily outer membrane receptor